MKKLSLTLGTIVAVAAPVVSVVSCGPTTPQDTVKITKSDIKFYGPNGYGKVADTKLFKKIPNLDYDVTSISVDKKNFSNGDKVKVTIKQNEEYIPLPNGTHEQTFECVVSGLTEKVKPLFDADLHDPNIVWNVRRSLIEYSLQEHSKVFYDFANVTEIPDYIFVFDTEDHDLKITSLPENIDFGSLINMRDNFRYVTKLPEKINFSHLRHLEGLNNLTSLPENIDFSSITKINGLNGLTSLPENIDLSNVTKINGLNGLTSLPENIDLSNVTDFSSLAWQVFKPWFDSHKKASTTP